MKKTLILLLTALTIMSFSSVTVDNNPFVVIVDAGHGGDDSGTQVGEIKEKELAFSIAKRLQELADGKDIKIVLTRRNDENIALNDRIDLTKDFRGDLLVSLHMDADAKGSRSGIDCYVSGNIKNNESKEFGNILMNNFRTVDGIGVNEIKTANFHLLKNMEIPCVLIELGYLTNVNDFNFLTDKNNQSILAEKIFKSVQEFVKSK
jgi:N-acetylmuramoyl-L-alanine amidase